MFAALLYTLRGQGLAVGTGDWLGFLEALRQGLATDLQGLYRLGRALLCRTEADYDAWDLAFASVFRDLELEPELMDKLESWLARRAEQPDAPWLDHELRSLEELWEELQQRLGEQDGEHHGGDHWVGTGGRSPYGHSGRGRQGIRMGGHAGGRQAVMVAGERRWRDYRTDTALETRDLQVALRALRKLQREGEWELDLDSTIQRTCENAGEIEFVDARARENQVRVVLLMDTGGSMEPYADRVEQLFGAAMELGTFKSLDAWFFHNVPYESMYRRYETMDRVPTAEVLAGLTPRHRLLFVGDACMAPWELTSRRGWYGGSQDSGLDWLRRFRQRCPGSVWLNPEPVAGWRHPTIRTIGSVFPMFEISVDGLRRAVRKLRVPV